MLTYGIFLFCFAEECCIKGTDAATQQIRIGTPCSAPSNSRTLAIQLWWTIVLCLSAPPLQEDVMLLHSPMQPSRMSCADNLPLHES